MVVATSDPLNLYPLDEAAAALGCPIVPVLATREAIAKRIKTHLGVGSETIEGLLAQREEDEVELVDGLQVEDGEIAAEVQEASVVHLVNEILLEAIDSRASDVHIESQPSGVKVRYRIDGMLQPQPTPPEINRFQAAIISRLKIMARLNIAEKRLPQDGRIKLKVHGREVDVRVSVIPMLHGEGIVMRLLDKGRMEFSLEKLGMARRHAASVRRADPPAARHHPGHRARPAPARRRRSTARCSSIKSEDTKIITTEDPVEYQLEGINQIQVHPKIGLTFAASLRSILRHDPDVVLVGEIRDLETAENAIQASLTGHLVFSTLHTNDAPSAYTRLVDMGVEPFLVASTIEGGDGPAAGAHAVHEVPRSRTSPTATTCRPTFPWDDYRAAASRCTAQRLPAVPRAGLRRPAGHFRAVRHDRRRPATGPRPGQQLGNPQSRARRRHAHPAARRVAQGARRHHDGRRSVARDQRRSDVS